MDMKIAAALLGTLVGVLATVTIAWINQRTLHRRELIRDEVRSRETLYGDFIAECSRLLIDAFQHTLEKPETFVPLHSLLNRVRLCASEKVLTEAERLLERITEQYFSSNLSINELRELARSRDADPLRMFGEACRLELRSLRALM
jgi:hypothetical protein